MLVDEYRRIYGRQPGELLAGEVEFAERVERDFQVDRNWSFEIRAEECALLVIDLQEAIVNPDYGEIAVPEAYRQVPRVKELIACCRATGVKVVYTLVTTARDVTPADLYSFLPPVDRGLLGEGTSGAQLYHEIVPEPGERVIADKHTYDAFLGTCLDAVLRAQEVRTVIICGAQTNFCCETTARSANCRGYHVVFGADVTAADSALAHEATLRTLRRGFARVMGYQEIVDCLKFGDQRYLNTTRAAQW
jgi:nicotinamidase-related amidase